MSMIQTVLENLEKRTPLTVVSHGNIRNPSLRKFLLEKLKVPYGDKGSFLAEPFFEGMFPWQSSKEKLTDLVRSQKLHPQAEKAIRCTLPEGAQFLRSHQQLALEAVAKGKSIVVTTGTGSGKTECFLYPIINDLCRELDPTSRKPLEGVRALFLYPLNALIESQRRRFVQICKGASPENRIRFAMFNGNTVSRGKTQADALPELLYKQEIRAFGEEETPPNLLVTNSTMLELALVRKEDQQIFEKSQGKLKFVVLDEAHTYMGSDAAELAMRLRRTLHAFGVEPKDVRFIATSATTGDDTQRLKQFLAQIAGIGENGVEIIDGNRLLPPIEKNGQEVLLDKVMEATEMDPVALHGLLTRCKPAIKLREELHKHGKLGLGDIARILGTNQQTALDFMDRASQAIPQVGSHQFFLPLKSHLFQRAFQGAWACWNPDCSCKDPLLGADWKYGQIHLEPPRPTPDAQGVIPSNWDKCSCGSSLFEVLTCTHCGEPMLGAQEHKLELSLPGLTEEELEESSDEPDDDDGVGNSSQSQSGFQPVLIMPSVQQVDTVEWAQTYEEGRTYPRSRGFVIPKDHNNPVRCPSCEHPLYLKKSIQKRSSFPLAGSNLSSPRLSSKALYFGLAKLVLRSDVPSELQRPQQGRRMLGFTDSRQGTAYHAASQGLHAEIAATRVWLLDTLLDQGQSSTVEAQLQKQVSEQALLMGCEPALLFANEVYMKNLREKLNVRGVRFREVQKTIAGRLKSVLASLSGTENDIARLLHFPNGLQNQHINSESVAELLLWRELSFRTRRKKNLETLGLLRVEYGFEDTIQMGLKGFGGDLAKTRNFLKILLDYGFRAQGCLDSTWSQEDIAACYGARATKNPFDEKGARYGTSVSEPSRKRWIEVLGEELLKAEGRPSDWSALRELLLDAVDLLRDAGYLTASLELKTDQIRLMLPQTIWLCPVTKTLLDEPVGIEELRFSPYSVSPIQKHPVKIAMDGLVVPKTKGELQEWTKSFPDWWTDLHSEVLAMDPNDAYVVAQEHSAQLDKDDLKEHQDRFSQGCINLLNCSTTMEMGVDIGSISLVAMTNVPSYSHNYLQRAGRAGRGNQGQSLVWTLCGAGAHERQAWAAPLDWVKKSAYRPHVSLESRRIVQRHVNAWLLGEWMKKFGHGIKQPAHWFLGYRDGNGVRKQLAGNLVSHDGELAERDGVLNAIWKLMTDPDLETTQAFKDEALLNEALQKTAQDSLSEDFLDWLETTALEIPEQLVIGTPLQVTSQRQIVQEAIEVFRKARARWMEDVGQICTVLCTLKNPAGQWRLVYELKRLGDNPLATYLAEKGALPLNSLPSEVVQLSLHEKPSKKEKKGLGQDGKKKRYSNMPSRERSIAIREYAPGCGVIIDGKVHTVQYVVRNWKLQPGLPPDPQTLRDVRLCHKCGAARVSSAQMGGNPNSCPECNESLTSHASRKMLIPSGFIASRRITKNFDDVQRSSYEIPRLGIHSEAIRLPIQQGGELRAGRATVVYLNGGGWEQVKDSTEQQASSGTSKPNFGPLALSSATASTVSSGNQDDHFHVCMECGFSVPTPADGQNPTNNMPNHNRWDKANGAYVPCAGANKPKGNPVHQVVSLGALQETDAFSIKLPNFMGETARKAALTWALALRNVLAKALAIRKEELGWTARKGTDGWSMLVFDRAPGGADFAPKAIERLPELFREARKVMEECNCETVCHKCLLDREVQPQWNDLDRKRALEAIDERFVDQLKLPEHLRFWGDSSRACINNLAAEILGAIKQGSGELRIYLHGKIEDWDFENWALADSLRSWNKLPSNRARIFLSRETARQAQEHPFVFTNLIALLGNDAYLEVLPSLPCLSGNGVSLQAEFVQENSSTQWVLVSKEGLSAESLMGTTWGIPNQDSLLLCGKSPKQLMDVGGISKLRQEDLYPQGSKNWSMKKETAPFPVSAIWSKIFGSDEFIKWSKLNQWKVKSLLISDIYLRRPIDFAILRNIVASFEPEKVIVHNSYANSKYGGGWNGDYQDETLGDHVIKNLLKPKLVEVEHKKLPHDRFIILERDNGEQIRIDIGKGFGYWRNSDTSYSTQGPNSGKTAEYDAEIIKMSKNTTLFMQEDANFYATKLS